MRLFKSANKSQNSIPTSSRSSSPDPYAGGGVYAPQPDRFHQQPSQHPVDGQPSPYQQDPQIHTHPAHILSRGSSEVPTGYADTSQHPSQPTLNIVAPHAPPSAIIQAQGPAPVPGQTQFGQSKQVYVQPEKEHKRSKRSIFGLSSKDKDKEKENSPTEKKGLGRSSSIHLLRKHAPLQPSQDNHPQGQSPQSPQYQNVRHSAYVGRVDASQESIPEDPSHYEQYRQQQQPQPLRQQGQYESPQSQLSHKSPDYVEDTHLNPPPRDQYQPYQQPESANNSDQYLPYRGEQQVPNRPAAIVIDQHAALRPPSQASLGPPSPLIQPPHLDSRPSTAATSRYSTQSVGQPQQVQPAQLMARDAPQNGRGQQIRDPREEDHRQYQQDPRARMSQQVSDQGRNTPPPRNREDGRELDYNQLLQKHEELQAKYSKVKRYYFEREAQVTQLQNTVANQRLSMSKTSLDDAQYSARFERLSGAINNLSFNIRKDWKNVPEWLRPVCNIEAYATGTKEMTAIGRACITRWLAETVFDRIFHPSLPRDTSMLLKHVEKTLRRQGQAGVLLTDEQREDLTTKITTWRLTTIEGLADSVNSRFAPQIQEELIKTLTEELTSSLRSNLNDPPPLGLQDGVLTIVQQAVSISANIPLESRDICIAYFMPGESINDTYMKVETGMTPLINPGQDERLTQALAAQRKQEEGQNDDEEGDRDVEAEIREAASKASQTSAGNGPARAESLAALQGGASQGKQDPKAAQPTAGKQKSSFLGGLVNKKPAPSQSQGQSRQGSIDVRGQAEQQETSPAEQQEQMRMLGIQPLVPGEGKVRFAVFLAVEVRGKMLGSAGEKEGVGAVSAGVGRNSSERGVNVLYKAPVYEL